MRTTLFLLMSLFLWISCSDEADSRLSQPDDGSLLLNSQRMISAKVKNANGNDLLNPQTPGAIDLSKIKLYALTDEGEELYGGADSGFAVSVWPLDGTTDPTTGQRYVNLVLGVHNKGGWSKDLIRWNETLADTVVCEVDDEKWEIRKIYLNSELQYDRDDPTYTSYAKKWVTFIH